MAARIIDGKAIATDLCAETKKEVSVLIAKHGRQPGLAVVLIGNDPASEVYVGSKIRQTEMVGMRSFEHRLPENTSEDSLLGLISQLNTDNAVDGILVQLPLPAHINAQEIIEAIDPSKDVDGFHPVNVGKLMVGLPGLVACTPMGALHLLKSVHSDLSGMNALVIGRSNIVGKPVAQLLLQQNATVTVAHSQTRDLPAICRMADIIIAAVGKPEFVRGDWIKPGATVIDVGINRLPAELKEGKGRLVGDVAYEEAKAIAGAITPVPGGVGPMTIAILLKNTLQAYNTGHAKTFSDTINNSN